MTDGTVTLFAEARKASKTLLETSAVVIDEVLSELSGRIREQSEAILAANREDLARMDRDDPRYDRLELTQERLEGIASDMMNVVSLPSPLHRTLEERTLPNGLRLSKVAVPFGVIGVIYESRPNVSFDVFSLCFKAGSACILKGGSDAICSNTAAVGLIRSVLKDKGLPESLVTLLPAGRESTADMLSAGKMIDLIIPRGSRSLIDFVKSNSTVPVIETGAGVCHAYFDKEADLAMGSEIIRNAKLRRVSVCNALDCLVIHSSRLDDLKDICGSLPVEIYADERAYKALIGCSAGLHKAGKEDFGREFLSAAMAVRTVDSLDEAMEHISEYGTGHSECIISNDTEACERFLSLVDAACVYSNAPTSFTDGAQFGLGAEIGISTQKLHARGPMALREIMTYKWLIRGDGQTRK